MNPVLIKRGIDMAVSMIAEELDIIKRELVTREEKENVATISANNDREL
jgi:chaperonin GroEL (HSP60 family)